MQNEALFQVHYFVGALLVESGEVRLNGTQIVFTPTGVLEKMMNVKDVVIPMADIVAHEYTGGLVRTVRIQTKEKVHKFEGSETARLGEVLFNLLPNKAVRKPSKVQTMHPFIGPKYACSQCAFVAQPGFRVCPNCGAFPKNVCQRCRCLLDTAWTFCAYCGTKAASASPTSFQPNRVA